MEYKMIDPEKISFGKINPRKDLGDLSELQYDLQQRHKQGKRAIVVPLLVKKLENNPNYDYELIDGKRRLQSALSVKLPEVPVVLEDEVTDSTELVVMSVKANWDRKDFNWTEEAIAFENLQKQGLTQKEIGVQIGKTHDYVSERISTYKRLKNSERSELLDIITARNIGRNVPEEDLEEVVDLAIENELTERDVMKVIVNAKNVKFKLEQLEMKNKKLAEEFKKLYLPKRYTTNSAILLQKEIDLSTGYSKAVNEYLQADKYTEEEAREYAKEHYGEFLGKVSIEAWRVYVVPLSREEIRAKLEKL